MRIFAISDPHLSLGTPGKSMDVFGPHWVGHSEAIASAWSEAVTDEDLVLVPGDLSWAMKIPGALVDLEFLASLPGRKVICKGNHDYWWSANGKARAALPESMQLVQGDAIRVGSVVLCGTRLWDVPEVSFGDIIDWQPNAISKERPEPTDEDRARELKIYQRERGRLDASLTALSNLAEDDDVRVVLTHYPPCSADLQPNELTRMFERAGVHHVVFGHLHAVYPNLDPAPFGTLNGVRYHLTSCDYLGFVPVLIDTV